MRDLNSNKKELQVKMNTEDLNPTQIRLIKSINALMAHVIVSDDENEYFETSADLMKKVAELIKHSNFSENNKTIEYGDQAIEFAIDFLHESMNGNKIHNIDN